MTLEMVAQKIILVLALVSGYYVVICSPINYYGIASTIVLFLTFIGGILANRKGFRYTLPNGNGSYPMVSAIIPVKDEEKHIYDTIKSYAEVDYPKEKIEVIVVDDGSQDRTWREIQRAISDLSGLIKIRAFSFAENQGKRKALSVGFRRCSGEIIITTDSDTFVHANCVYNLVRAFERKEIAGATGHTQVKNKDKNVLTMMQAGLYFYAYRVVRAFESMLNTVLCLPGTLSAFRKEAVMEVIDEWDNSRPILGEDRHLTYLVLKHGHETVYVPNALCETLVPETLSRYLSQQLRWAKGYLVETLRGCKYMFRRHPLIAVTYYAQYFLTLLLSSAIIRILIHFLNHSPFWWDYFLYVGIAFLLKAFYSWRISKDNTCWAMMFFVFVNLLMNSWRIPVALLTVSSKTIWRR